MEITSFNAAVEVDLDEPDDVSIDEIEEKELKLEAEYDKYAAECEAAMDLTLARIKYVQETINRSGKPNPIDRIEYRVKTFKSAKGKCKDRGYKLNIESIRENVKDIGGIRIMTKYLDDIYVVKDMVAQIPGVNIVVAKDYVANPKKNGYQSLHLGCQVEIYDPIEGSKLIPVEIQVRTKIMNLWSGYDHDFNYKSDEDPDIKESFSDMAEEFRKLEAKMMSFRDKRRNIVDANS